MSNHAVIRVVVFLALVLVSGPAWAGDSCDYLSDAYDELVVQARQGWGKLGLDTAAAPTDGRPPGRLRIGETYYDKGLGHHASGELVFQLPEGEYTAFAAEVGVHWQGGGRGSLIFQAFVDGEKRFDSGVMSDSDGAVPVNVSVIGARELRLVASSAGDGIICDMAEWANARLVRDPNALRFGPPTVMLNGEPASEPSGAVCGFSLLAHEAGPQAASLGDDAFVVCVREGEEVALTVPVSNLKGLAQVEADIDLLHGQRAQVALNGASEVVEAEPVHMAASCEPASGEVCLRIALGRGEALVRCRNVRLVTDANACDICLLPRPSRLDDFPSPVLPPLRDAMAQALIEWDWRMQDGVGTPREAVPYAVAVERLLASGDALLRDLRVDVASETKQWEELAQEHQRLVASAFPDTDPRWEDLWRRVHHVRRCIVFRNPLFDTGPLVFAKRVPGSMSHQLTQYYGRCARAGGGLFILDAPGESMRCRELVGGEFPPGSFMQPEVRSDGQRILFAYCEVPWTPTRARKLECLDRHYHLFEIRADGSGLRQLTEGPFDDFSPCELPNGDLMFLSTRRGGFHRCGAGPCPVYTLTLADADGANPHTVSYHETHEWDPAVLADGRIIYTRWDYVDRNAVHYQQLWTVRQDGSAPTAYYGNNTFNPVGVWEPRQVPNSPLVMATAAAHHAMTAGSIILLDTSKAVDGLDPITRLTPDAPFPESETHVAPRNWHAPGSPKEYATPEAQRRWPGHCYRTPWPLSEKYFLAAYSFDPLIGEPDGNKANMFGLYAVDAFGNKELLYRDLNIASLWPVPVRPRAKAPVMYQDGQTQVARQGTFSLQDVYASDPRLPKDSVKRLRILQVLPKTTPNANNPPVGLANASPGKQVLGTVPVEADGSAHFQAPAGVPLSFQALDEKGRAIQIMRSITYLQPGERMSCVGCHEDRLSAPPRVAVALAMRRKPSVIEPAPDGSNPLSYPLLVQPVLEKRCVACHSGDTPAGPEGCPIVLTSEPEGRYTKSYNVLAKRVPFSAWGGLEANGEPLTQPDRFGARASSLMKMLLAGHHDVKLDGEDMARLTTWMDANALFYGTFDAEDQARQRRGERIEGPALQ